LKSAFFGDGRTFFSAEEGFDCVRLLTYVLVPIVIRTRCLEESPLFGRKKRSQAALEPAVIELKPEELRRFPRLACPAAISVECKPVTSRREEDPFWVGKIRNISEGGLELHLSRRFERGSGLIIRVPAADHLPESTWSVRVVHVRKASEVFWVHGCQFTSLLHTEEVIQVCELKAQTPEAQALPAS
jgi:hypothetical protein